jgi:hypothetical protein
MRKVREVLRLKHVLSVSERQIAITVGVLLWSAAVYRANLENSPYFSLLEV